MPFWNFPTECYDINVSQFWWYKKLLCSTTSWKLLEQHFPILFKSVTTQDFRYLC